MCPMELQVEAPAAGRSLSVPAPLGLLSDERLARMVGQGNERAFGTLYSRYHQQLYRYCHSMVRHEADAQDALQTTFTSALTALRRGQRDAPLRPWLYRIAHNESISLLRRRRVVDELPETMEASGLSVEAAAEERAQLALLVSDLQAMPERQRGALVMRELSGLSHEELAQALGISVGAAKQSVFEARQALQEFAEGRAMACNEIQRIVSDGDKRALRGRRVRAHLRECSRCDAFAGAIPERRAAMLALSPALPAAAASGLFARITGGTAHHGSGGLLASAGGKSLGVALSAKSVATGIAIVATATVGAVGAVEVATHSSRPAVRGHQLKDGHSQAGAAAGASARGSHGAGTAARGQNGARGHGSHRALNAHARSHRAGAAGSQGLGAALFSTAQRQTSASANASGTNANAHSGNPNAGGGNTAGSGNAGGTNPNAHGGNPNASGGNGSGGATNPNAHGGNPNAGGGNTAGSGNAGGTNPNAHGGNPNAGSGSTNAHGSNPNAGGGNPNAAGGNSTGGLNTNSHGGNPNAGGGNPNAGGGSTNAGTGSTNAHGSNPHAHGGY
jgi:RNA polymerase sigma factor (sigma-70 family)